MINNDIEIGQIFSAKIINVYNIFWWYNKFIGEIVDILKIRSNEYYVIDNGVLDIVSYPFYDFKKNQPLSIIDSDIQNIKVYGQIKTYSFISIKELRLKKIRRILDED